MKINTDRNATWQSIRDASFTTGLSAFYIRQGVQNGTFPHIKSGSKVMVNVPKLLEKVEQQSQAGAAN